MLEKIVAQRRLDLKLQKQQVPETALRRKLPEEPPESLLDALTPDRIRIIAEVKFKSPSQGLFPSTLNLEDRVATYAENGAAAISVLTEERHFQGKLEHLERASRAGTGLPLLRKDFIVDCYQVLEAAVHRASGYLLIVACLEPRALTDLIQSGNEFRLTPLVEVHDERELEIALQCGAHLIGVNNRNLKTFQVRLQTSFDLARRLEGVRGVTLVSESGLSEHSQIRELRDAGFQGFLVGTRLMTAPDPGRELRRLLGSEQ